MYKVVTGPHLLSTFLFLETSVVDPDPHGSALIVVGWIRIRTPNADPDPGPGGQKYPTKKEKMKKYIVLRVGFSCGLDIRVQ